MKQTRLCMLLFTAVLEPVQFLQMTKYDSCSSTDNNINKIFEDFFGEIRWEHGGK